jgi:hypothetical protein
MNILILFFAGLFLANGLPHFVHGISGKRFPSPFAKPPGKGLSSSVINVLWGLFNFLVAIILIGITDKPALWLKPGFFALAVGFVTASIGLAIVFQSAEREK